MKSTMIALAAVALLASQHMAAAADEPGFVGQGLVGQIRKANSRFETVAQAIKEGYAPIPCTSGVDGGAMGIHFVNADLVKDENLDIAKPEAVMYEPDEHGKMKLVAVEYITTKGPANLGGQLFSFTGAPNRYGLPAFYELHVWAWKDNPKGPFSDMNPQVSCRHAHG